MTGLERSLQEARRRIEEARDEGFQQQAIFKMSHSTVKAVDRGTHPTAPSYKGFFSDSVMGDVYEVYLECGHRVVLWDTHSRPPVGTKFACLTCGPHQIGVVR